MTDQQAKPDQPDQADQPWPSQIDSDGDDDGGYGVGPTL